MNYKFIAWYTQALGAVFGIIACLFGYLNGYMFVYGNISRNVENLTFSGLVSSYLLFPLCILILVFSLFISISKDTIIFKMSYLNYFNLYIIIVAIIIGFMGTRGYFCVAALFMITNQILHIKKRKDNLENEMKKQDVKNPNFEKSKNLHDKNRLETTR